MRFFCKCFGLFGYGVFSAVLYPILHECGHALAAVLCGVRIVEFRLLPIAYTLCDFQTEAEWQIAAVGLGGMLWITVFLGVFRPKRFWIWYMRWILLGIHFANALCAMICMLFAPFTDRTAMKTEDLAQVQQMVPQYALLCWAAASVTLCLCLVWLCYVHPLRRCYAYFGIRQKNGECKTHSL